MRLVETITHSHCRVSIHSYNQKYLVKIEFKEYAIECKISETDISLQQLKAKITKEWIDSFAPDFSSISKKWAKAIQNN